MSGDESAIGVFGFYLYHETEHSWINRDELSEAIA